MTYKFNQSKKFQAYEIAFAFLSHFTTALTTTMLLYALSNLFLIVLFNSEIDVIGISYLLIFIVLFFIFFLGLMLYYLKLDKGIKITDSKLIYKIGYFAKFTPVKIFGFYDEIKISDISDVEVLDYYNWKELKKDYHSYNFRWFCFGVYSKNIPVVKVTVNDNNYLFPLEKSDEFADKLKSIINS